MRELNRQQRLASPIYGSLHEVAESLEAFADRGYFKGEEILACDEAGITVTLPKPQTKC